MASLDLSTTQSVTLSMATTVHSSMATTVQSSMVTTVQSMVLDVPATTESPVDAFPPNVPTTTRPQSTTYSMTTFMTARDVPNEVTTVPVTSSMTLIIVIAATLSVATVMVLIAVVIIVICLVQRYRNGKKAVGDGEVKGASNIVDQQVRRNESDADLKSRVEGKEESMYALHGDHLAHLNRDKNDDGYTNIDECQRESGHIPPTTSTNLRDLKEKVQCETVERDKGHMEPHTEGEEQTTANHYEQIPHSELWHSNETTTDLKGYSCSPEYASLGAGRGDLQLPRYDTVKGYEQITGYEEPATYEVATTYQSVAGYEQVATYESAVTYQKVPTESLTALPQE